jgi:hypothetical protein
MSTITTTVNRTYTFQRSRDPWNEEGVYTQRGDERSFREDSWCPNPDLDYVIREVDLMDIDGWWDAFWIHQTTTTVTEEKDDADVLVKRSTLVEEVRDAHFGLRSKESRQYQEDNRRRKYEEERVSSGRAAVEDAYELEKATNLERTKQGVPLKHDAEIAFWEFMGSTLTPAAQAYKESLEQAAESEKQTVKQTEKPSLLQRLLK